MFNEEVTGGASLPRAKVKMRLAGGEQPLILVPVSVNESEPRAFIFDTGAGTTLVASEFARDLNLKVTGTKEGQTAGGAISVQLGQADSLRVGSTMMTSLDVAIADLSHVGAAVGARVDGDLGYNFNRHFRITIDYGGQTLRFDDPKRVEAVGDRPLTLLPMRLAHPAKPLILIEAHIGKRGPFQFAVDTGTSTSAISVDLARELGVTTRPMAPVTTGGASLAMRAAEISDLRVGHCQLPAITVIIGDFLTILSEVIGSRLDGIIGYNFLRHFKVALDYPQESFSLFAP